MMRSMLILGNLLTLFLAMAAATEPTETVTKFEVTPAAEPKPALKYRLVARYLDQTPGNAVPLYLSATTNMAAAKPKADYWDKVANWLTLPPADLPAKEVEEHLREFGSGLSQVQLATRREACQWDFGVRENGFAAILAGVSELRNYGRLLALKARLQIGQQKYNEAIETLTTLSAMSLHVNEGQTLVTSLISIALDAQILDQVEAWIQTPGSPNLYWALTTLPSPWVNLRPAINGEMDSLYLTFPYLAALNRKEATADQWDAAFRQFKQDWPKFTLLVNANEEVVRNEEAAWKQAIAAIKPAATAWHKERGLSAEALEKLSEGQLVLEYFLTRMENSRDEVTKWLFIPVAQSQSHLEELAQRNIQSGGMLLDFTRLILPAYASVNLAPARLERRLAALRCVEAIRMSAAGTEPKLPMSLGDIRVVPAPLDPGTNGPFGYEVKDGKATLTAGPLGNASDARNRVNYEIRLRPAK